MKGRLQDLAFGRNRRQRVTIEVDGDLRSTYDQLSGKDVEVSIKPYREKRSLDANAFCWTLVDKLAAAMGIPKVDVYRDAIRSIGGVSETVCVTEGAVDTLCRVWEHNGLGWQAERFQSKLPGCVNVTLYYGSSAYDSAQMSALIDHLVEDCKALDIETMPPDKLAAMLESWEAKK